MSRWFMAAMAVGSLYTLLQASLARAAQDENPIVSLVKSRVSDPEKPFVLVVTFEIKPGQETAFEKGFAPAIEETLKEKGCIQYTLSRDTESPQTYMLYERWKSVADLDAHLKTPHLAALGQVLGSTTASAPKAQVFLPVGD